MEANKYNFSNFLIELNRKKYEKFLTQDLSLGLFNVTFKIEDKLLYADIATLASGSPVFQTQFLSRWRSDGSLVEGYTFEDFKTFITFFYSGVLNLTDANVITMTKLADYYDVNCAKDWCDDFLSKCIKDEKNLQIPFHIAAQLYCNLDPDSYPLFRTNLRNVVASIAIDWSKFPSLDIAVVKLIIEKRTHKESADFIFDQICNWAMQQPNYGDTAVVQTARDLMAPLINDITFKKLKLIQADLPNLVDSNLWTEARPFLNKPVSFEIVDKQGKKCQGTFTRFDDLTTNILKMVEETVYVGSSFLKTPTTKITYPMNETKTEKTYFKMKLQKSMFVGYFFQITEDLERKKNDGKTEGLPNRNEVYAEMECEKGFTFSKNENKFILKSC